MAQIFKDLSIVEPGHNPFTGEQLAGITTAGCCQGAGDRVFQLEKPTDTELQFISTATLSTGDFVVKLRVFPSSDDDSVGFIFWRSDEHNYYELRLGHNTLNTASINRVVNGVVSEVTADTTITAVAGRVAYVRIKLDTNQIRARIWRANVAEPSTWGITQTVTMPSGTGFGFSQASARFVDWHWITSSDVTTEPAYKATIPANDTTEYPGGNLTVSGAGYYHRDDADGLGLPAVSARARVYDQQTGILVSRNKSTDASARFNISDLKTADNCYATFSPIDPAARQQTGIANLLMPARPETISHTVPNGAPTTNPATYFVLHLPSDASNLVRIAKTDGTDMTSSQLFALSDKLTGYQGFDTSGAINLGTWTVTSLVTSTAGRYQLFYVDRDLPPATTAGASSYDDRVLYASRTRAPAAAAGLTTQQEGAVRGIVTKQSGTLLDNLVECFLTLGVERDSVAPSSVALTNNNARTIPTADNLSSGTCTALLISGYDPLILDDNRILLLAAGTSGSTLSSTRRITFNLTNNGVPSAVEINIGHTSSGQILISKSSTTANVTLSIILANLSGIGTIDHIKRVVEAATGTRQINQQSFEGVAHTVFYTGSATIPPDTFQQTVKAGSICIKNSTHEIFYRQVSTPTAIANRDQIRFTTGTDGYRLGEGVADRVPNQLLGFFYRGELRSQSNFNIGLRSDVLPTGIGDNIGDTFQARWATGTSTPTGSWTTFTRTRSSQQISGHNYLFYGSPLVASSTALSNNQSYTMQFRSSASGNPAINVYPATTSPTGSWQKLMGGTSGGAGFTQAQVEEYARDAVGLALTTGDDSTTADIQFSINDSSNTIEARIKTGSIQSGDIKRSTSNPSQADDLGTWKGLLDIPDATAGDTPTNRLIPEGGTAGQVLGKLSETIYNTGWIDRLSESDKNKLDQVFDLIRDFDDIFTITAAYNRPDIGWANYRAGGVQRTFGTVSPTAPNPPTFSADGENYRVLAIFHQRDTVQKTLNIFIGGADNSVVNVPSLASHVEFKIAGTTYRARDYTQLSIPKSGNDDAYLSYEISLGQDSIFTAGIGYECQVLLPGGQARLVPPIAPSDIGKYVKANVHQQPEWDDLSGVNIAGLNLLFRRYRNADLSLNTEGDTNTFKNVIVAGDKLWVFGASSTSRLLSKVNRFSYPNPSYETQLTVTPINTDLAEGFIKGGEFYSLRATTTRSAAKVFQRYLLTNFSAQTTVNITDTTRLGDTITQGWFVTSDDDHYWVSEQYGKTNKYRKDNFTYDSTGNIDPQTGTSVTYACSAVDNNYFYLIHDDTVDATARKIDFVAFSKADGSRASTADFSINIDNQTEWANFRTYGGVEIHSNQLYLVTGVSGRVRVWSQETPDQHIAQIASRVAGSPIVKSPVIPTITVPANGDVDIYINNLPDALKHYVQLYDFDVKEQVTFTKGTTGVLITLQLIAKNSAGHTTSEGRPFTLGTSALTGERVVFDSFSRPTSTTAPTPPPPPDRYTVAFRNLSSTPITLTNVFSIAYPRTEIQYDALAAERLNPNYVRVTGRRGRIPTVTDFSLNSNSAPVTTSNLEAIAFNNERQGISVVDSAGNHRLLRNYTYTQNYWTLYNFTIPDAATPAYACWDTTGQYFYYVTGGTTPVLRCYDADLPTTTPSPTRDTTREFVVTALVTGQTNILGIDFHDSALWLLVYDATNYRVISVRPTTTGGTQGEVLTNTIVTTRLATGNTPVGLSVGSDYMYTSTTITSPGSSTARYLEIRDLVSANDLIKDSFPVLTSFGSTSARVKDITVNKRSNINAGGADPVVVAFNPRYSDSIRTFGTTQNIPASATLSITIPTRLGVLDWSSRSTAPNRLWQIIENPTTGKLYCLYGAQTSFWNDDSVLMVETRTSWANPVVESTSVRYGSSYGWRSTAPLAQGFLKGNLIYCPERFSENKLHTIDLSNNYAISTSAVVTLTGMTGVDATQDIISCTGNSTTFWVQKRNTAYAFNVSDFSRDESRDFTFVNNWSSSRHSRYMAVDSKWIYEVSPSSTYMTLYRRDLNTLALDSAGRRFFYHYGGSSYNGLFFSQYRNTTNAVADRDSVGFAFTPIITTGAVLGFVESST